MADPRPRLDPPAADRTRPGALPPAAVEAPERRPPTPLPTPSAAALEARDFTVRFRGREILRRISLRVERGSVLAVMGPSGVGKSTLLRACNRLLDLVPGMAVEGELVVDGLPIYGGMIDPDDLRVRIGMLFQQPVVFPGSVRHNLLFAVRRLRLAPRRSWPGLTEEVLRRVGLWEEVRGRLDEPAAELSVGQQQRLCLARALTVEPRVLLMDEPTSALDPASTRGIEELIAGLRETTTVLLVTHDPEQARRTADAFACLCLKDGAGELVTGASCAELAADPACHDALERLQEEPT